MVSFIGICTLEGIIRRNAHKIANFPGASALAGIFADDTPTQEPEEREATFRKKETTDVEVTYERVSNDEENIISEEDKDLIEFLKHLHEKFSEEEFDQIMSIIAYLYKKPKALPETIDFLEEWEEDSDDNHNEEIQQKVDSEETTQQPEYSETEEFPQTC